VGYEKWYPGRLHVSGKWEEANPRWLYSRDGQYWNPEYIIHSKKQQFTGLLDKHGKEVFEGDILRYSYGARRGESFIGEVVYEIRLQDKGDNYSRHVGFMLRAKERGEYWYTDIPDVPDIEVIGNVWEHPELLSPHKKVRDEA
jgi:uncharacterized phage protein (TIGR01671 family)